VFPLTYVLDFYTLFTISLRFKRSMVFPYTTGSLTRGCDRCLGLELPKYFILNATDNDVHSGLVVSRLLSTA
jgi:hypothetical protein